MLFAKVHPEELLSEGPCPTSFSSHQLPIAFGGGAKVWTPHTIRSAPQLWVERRCFLLTCNEAHADVELQDAGTEGG